MRSGVAYHNLIRIASHHHLDGKKRSRCSTTRRELFIAAGGGRGDGLGRAWRDRIR